MSRHLRDRFVIDNCGNTARNLQNRALGSVLSGPGINQLGHIAQPIMNGGSLMANSAIARLTGTVLRTQHRDGTSKAGNPYQMEILTVLVAGAGTTEISFFTSDVAKLGGALPAADDYIDWAIEVTRSERGFNMDVLGVWPQEYSDRQRDTAELEYASSK